MSGGSGGGGGGDGGEKSFEPTPRRLEEARRRGEVPRSADVAAAAAYLGLLAAIAAFGAGMAREAGAALMPFLGRAEALEGRILGPGGAGLAASMLGEAVRALVPLLLLPFVLTLAALLAQGAFVPAPDKLAPKLSRISPAAVAARKFGRAGLVEFARSLAKAAAVSAALWFVLAAGLDRLLGTVRAPPALLPAELLDQGTGLLAVIAALAVAIGAIDYLWQRIEHARRLRMSHRELRDELRESEGDPQLKAVRRRRAEALARNRMLAEVPKADVVIVNPVHYAVALRWSRRRGSAPECVARGVDEVALAIRRRAMEAGVPVRADPPTARALYALVAIGEEVPPELWRAVAAAIRYATAMRARARAGWRNQ
jgi:flagellar biosynthetic protein FlhB